jgi:hypothetical protein
MFDGLHQVEVPGLPIGEDLIHAVDRVRRSPAFVQFLHPQLGDTTPVRS